MEEYGKINEVLNNIRLFDQNRKQGVIPFFDVCFIGMNSGDINQDNLVLKIFLEEGIQILVAHSFSKIMSLYGKNNQNKSKNYR